MRVLIAALLLACAVPVAAGQLQLGKIQGIVVDDSDSIVPVATVRLTDPLGGVLAVATTDNEGRFAFSEIVPGRYEVKASLAGFADARHSLTIIGAIPVNVTLRMRVNVEPDLVVVEGGPLTPASLASLTSATMAHVPIRNGARGVQDIVATLPGWSTEDNGLLHARGIDDGFLYVVDGIPVYERLDQLSGIAPDAASIESVNVMTGYLPAEFGYKAGGVINVRSKSARSGWTGSAAIDAGSEQTRAISTSIGGPLSSGIQTMVAAGTQRSDRFLDPVHPDNLHNNGGAGSVAGNLMWTLSDWTVISASGGAGRSEYDVPNTEDQEMAHQEQRQRIEQWFGAVDSQHAWSLPVYSQFAAYARRSAADLNGSEHDTPLHANASRTLERAGVIASVTWHSGQHVFKGGAEFQRLALREHFQFAVTDRAEAREAGFSRAVLAFGPQQPFTFAGNANPKLFAIYLQDDWQATSAMTINGGVRFDRASLLLPRSQVSPRLGLTYQAGTGSVLRGSISRFYQPPQPEYLLLSSSPEARVLSPFADDDSGGGADIEPERQWAFEVGVAHRFDSPIRLDAAVWYKTIEQVADPNVFAGTTIIFPNAVATGHAQGVDARLEVTRSTATRWRDWSGYANVSIGRVRQAGPITGGLFLEDGIAELGDGEEFIPDHDQRVVASGGVTWTHNRSAAAVTLVARYESGTPIERDEDDEDELRGRPGSEMVDFESGRVKPRTIVSLQADMPVWKRARRSAHVTASLLNLFDQRYAYNFGNPFSGTHFGAPRTFSVAARLAF